MAVDNPRVRARTELEELGVSSESASYLVDDRPSGGWDSLTTLDQLLLTKAELRTEMAEIRTEMAEIRTEMATLGGDLRTEIATLGGDLRTEMTTLAGDLRTEMTTLAGDLRTEMERGFKAQTWRLVTALIGTVTLMSVILRVV